MIKRQNLRAAQAISRNPHAIHTIDLRVDRVVHLYPVISADIFELNINDKPA